MRRLIFTVAATVLVAGAVPASALARHHHKHHARTHHARIRRFGDVNSPATSTSSSDNAGTVQSFSDGVLTIALNDGSTVSGKVTSDTELECSAPEQSTTTHEEGDGGSGDQSSSEDESSSEDNGSGDDQGENQSSCSTSNLTAGTVVHEATLRIGSAGAIWQKVELVS